jgi:RNA polymerase sigma factor (sigma-70 family)
MTNGPEAGVLRQIRRLVAADGALPDRDLLERFVRQRDEAAFAVLVRRHGPMVQGVCRRVLGNVHDAEDACQAAFLALALRAASINNRASVGGWLHGVAYRVAANLKRQVARRHAREVLSEAEPGVEPAEASWREVRAILDEELGRLPERLRAPLLLCYVEEKTRDEAAQELGWSVGTLRGRLERGRELLRGRLARRGVTLSAALLATLLTRHAARAALPTPLTDHIVTAAARAAAGQAVTGAVPARVATLAEGVLRTMFVNRLKTLTAVVMILGAAGIGAGVLAGGLGPQEPPAARGAGVPAAGAADVADVGPTRARAPGGAGAPASLARREAESRANLKKLAIAMLNHADAHTGHFPAPAIYAWVGPMGGFGGGIGGGGFGGGAGFGWGIGGGGFGNLGALGMQGGALGIMGGSGGSSGGAPMGGGMGSSLGSFLPGGKALLSWRVALLPYLGEDNLYRQFKLSEAWDGPHNKKLLEKMPQVYAAPGVQTREPSTTFYQVFVGPHAAFEKHRNLRLPADFPDGTSNTLLIVEAGSPVPWTKPEDLHYAADEPLPELGGIFPNIFNAAFADGSVHKLLKKGDPETLRRLIARDDGHPVDLNEVLAPGSRREVELRQENARLRDQLAREKTRLDTLKKELQDLQEPESPEVEQLRKENAELRRNVEMLRNRAGQLREQINRLKEARGKPTAGGGGK